MGKTINISGFPSYVSAASVKEYLEGFTGEGTVYAVKVRKCKTGARLYAIVQFLTAADAERIISLATPRMWYGKSYLTARKVEHDIVPKPRVLVHSMDSISLHFGCQVAAEKFLTFWYGSNVAVNFGLGLRRFSFYMEYRHTEYKLELSYENIWRIERHRSSCLSQNYLLIRLYGAPFIFKKVVPSSGHALEDPFYNYFMDDSDGQWVRTTDFSPSASIGQSSALILEIPRECRLPDFQADFPDYVEKRGTISLETGHPYSCNLDIVPTICPPSGVNLPYDILFKINMLVQNGYLAGPCLDSSFYRMVDPRRIDKGLIQDALEKMYHLKECCYEPSRWLMEQYKKYLTSRHSTKLSSITLDSGLVYVHRIQITPSRVYFFGPEVNVSNHVLRMYSQHVDNFLRVSFVDEDFEKIHSTDLSPRSSLNSGNGRTEIYDRIISILRSGITIGNKKFEFLAFSSSQIRESSAWMFAPINEHTAKSIRERMGEFRQIRNVAKYAARLGQSLSSSTETLNVSRDEIREIPDIKIVRDGICYNFSDGIGKISEELAEKVAVKCGFKYFVPSAFQIRYGGYKGVVAVDPNSLFKLSLRDSMAKFESKSTKLNVLTWSKYQPCFLNRQFITLLSTLGVPDYIFEKKQSAALDQLNAILTNAVCALEALELMFMGEIGNMLREMLTCGYRPDAEPFLSMMLQTFRAARLFEMRTKTRIFLPEGRSMMGCLDETRTLGYGQVFVQCSGKRRRYFDNSAVSLGDGSYQDFIIKGKVVVAKNPCLHPGDVRVLTAVDVPDLHHMVDCVVFPQKGKRPHPNECSGSDLDGDIYLICWDTDLIPPRLVSPMDYTPAPTVELDHDVTIEEVEEYFVNYIVNDCLGIIANAHTVFADRSPEKAMSKECLELAKLFSIAVDFPKTGVPAEIPQHLYAKEYPDFMEKLDKPTYESRNVIGKLFRKVKDVAPSTGSIKKFTMEVASSSYDRDMEVDGFENYVDDAFYHKGNYDYKLGNLMEYYGIKTEAEILSGNVMKMSKSFTKSRDAEAINMAVKALRKEARGWFRDDSKDADEYAIASAWYHVTYHPTYFGQYNEGLNRDHYISFPWCLYDKLVQIKKKASARAVTARGLADVFANYVHLLGMEN